MTEAEIIQKLLAARGLKSKKSVDEFFHPVHPSEIKSPFDPEPAIKLIKSHIKKGNKIAIYGDYDVDGICSTAILWETLYQDYKNVFPHIPHRREEGYGLSIAGIDHCLSQGAKLIITVDNGIVAHDQIKYCRDQGCDIIIIDHHEKSDQLPNANVILHSTNTCAAGLTWFFCRDLQKIEHWTLNFEHLSLVALAVICDIVPLLGINRSFAKFGLEELNKTQRPGLLALFEEAAIKPLITPYHVGFIIGPRLNAAGRLEHAIDSLRLLCTKDSAKARQLALHLGETNRARQDLTLQSTEHALNSINLTNLLVVAHESYDEGIIGLIAAKLVEKHHRPAIAISIGEKISKGSARSIPGFHITDHLRSYSHLLENVGGHAMAAGFTIDNSRIQDLISSISNPDIPADLLIKKQRIDLEIPLGFVNLDLWIAIQKFEPFGLGNPTPVFLTKNVQISNIRKMGKLNQHLKFNAGDFEAVYFNVPLDAERYPLDAVDLVYQIGENTWNGTTKLQLIVKDIQSSP
ncbi:MAG: single-stranded-DNA-specific exonuclease [Microgenomates group bacterium Gr01-1014_16]|nr:MAG: single-stranded-DNA-specific exonuclease [Microgenomates group bacterium Gr01-1014_16]